MKKSIKIVVLLIFLLVVAITIIMLPGKSKPTQNLDGLAVATFAGGCFWCVEADFEKLPGVVEVISGYTGGSVENPKYKEVSSGNTGHREAVQVYYKADEVNYRELVQYLFQHIDPIDRGGSFGDRGKQYSSAIFYASDEEKKIAEDEIARLNTTGVFEKKIATEVIPISKFYNAEDYHQDYYKKNKLRYKYYRGRSGRDDFLEKTWKSGSEGVKNYQEEIGTFDLSSLTSLQYKVTQEDGTEPAFDNKYWNESRDGIYVDIVSGEALFSSLDKYKSGTGWPSFTRPINQDAVVEREDNKLFTKRVEVRSRNADSHLGHVFNDGPKPTGERYCMNSAALRFIPKEDLEKEGYGEYLKLFE